MNEWIKLAITLIGFGVITWTSVQQHEYRLSKLETSFSEHLKRHDEQNEEIQKTLINIQVDVGRLVGRKD